MSLKLSKFCIKYSTWRNFKILSLIVVNFWRIHFEMSWNRIHKRLTSLIGLFIARFFVGFQKQQFEIKLLTFIAFHLRFWYTLLNSQTLQLDSQCILINHYWFWGQRINNVENQEIVTKLTKFAVYNHMINKIVDYIQLRMVKCYRLQTLHGIN